MDQINLLSSLTYIDTVRSIEAGEMKIIKNEYNLQLYEDTLIASAKEYEISNVWDISYKSFSEDANLLYLHTHNGVVTYKVYTDPDHFVATFKKLKNVNY